MRHRAQGERYEDRGSPSARVRLRARRPLVTWVQRRHARRGRPGCRHPADPGALRRHRPGRLPGRALCHGDCRARESFRTLGGRAGGGLPPGGPRRVSRGGLHRLHLQSAAPARVPGGRRPRHPSGGVDRRQHLAARPPRVGARRAPRARAADLRAGAGGGGGLRGHPPLAGPPERGGDHDLCPARSLPGQSPRDGHAAGRLEAALGGAIRVAHLRRREPARVHQRDRPIPGLLRPPVRRAGP